MTMQRLQARTRRVVRSSVPHRLLALLQTRRRQSEREGYVYEAIPLAAPDYRLRCRCSHCRLWCRARQPLRRVRERMK